MKIENNVFIDKKTSKYYYIKKLNDVNVFKKEF